MCESLGLKMLVNDDGTYRIEIKDSDWVKGNSLLPDFLTIDILNYYRANQIIENAKMYEHYGLTYSIYDCDIAGEDNPVVFEISSALATLDQLEYKSKEYMFYWEYFLERFKHIDYAIHPDGTVTLENFNHS